MNPIFLLSLLLLAIAAQPLSPPPRTNLPTPLSHTPQRFCKHLLNDPKPLSSSCQQSTATKKCRDGSYRFFSQMKQDYYIYTRHFRNLRRRGIYIDVAANDPIHISNTYFMDACLGWSGLCVEALPQLIPRIHEHRKCALVPTCVGDRDGVEVDFVLDGGLSGVRATNKNKVKWGMRNMKSIKKVCSTLKREFDVWDIGLVDYMSLDVEGHELNVLKGIDWNKVRINVITVETTKESLDKLERFLNGVGYVRHWAEIKGSEKSGLLNEDAVFLYKDVVWGHPK